MRLQHFLITRFNLRLQGVARDKRGGQVLTRDWLEERLEIFEHYCLPSVLNQTEQRFVWLLLLDEATDREVVKRVEGYRRLAENLEPVYLPPIGDAGDLARPVRERLSPETEILVTSRLDNDDALHEDALAAVRRRVRGRREFLNLRLGFVTEGSRARVVSHKYGPFTSLVEPLGNGPLLTVYCTTHGRQRRVAPVRQIAQRPLWLRVVHARNVANTAFEERRAIDFRSPRQLHAWFRHRVARRVRRRFWPEALRREYRIEEIAGSFHIGELASDNAVAPDRAG
jgi:hypothetical protein